MGVSTNRNIKVIRRRITADGTTNVHVGFPIGRMSLTCKGVVAATNAPATPTAWKVEVKGRPAARDTGTAVNPTATVIDDHTSGVEADGACVQSTCAGILTNVDIVMSTLNLGATATAIDVEIVLAEY